MEQAKFEEVINFAIEREYEAANFYKELQGTVRQNSSKKMLEELEQMELNHAEILKNFTEEGVEEFEPPNIKDLKLSDYMVKTIPNSEMTYQEVLVTAMKREEASKKLYTALANEADNEKTKNLFQKLASEESKHKLQLETLYDDEIYQEN